MKKSTKPFWNLNIDSTKEANENITGVAWALVILGIITAALGFIFPENISIFDGIIYVFLGSLFGYKRNKWIAILVILLAASTLFSTFYNKLNHTGGGANLILAIIIFYYSIKAFLSVHYLKSSSTEISAEQETSKGELRSKKLFPIIFGISILMLIGFFTLFIFYPPIPN